MEFKDYYATLGVERQAPDAEIKKAYRRLVRKHHPDVNPAPDAKQRMQDLNEAWEVLRDAERRAAYDQLAARRAEPAHAGAAPRNWDEGFEYPGAPGEGFSSHAQGEHSDFFEAVFGARQRRPRGSESTGTALPERGRDHHARIDIALEDCFAGAERQLSLERAEYDAQGHLKLGVRTLQVRIPPGVRPGQQIRLAGQGGPGWAGGPAGDLFLEVQLQPHERYRVEGSDLYVTLPLAPWEAMLGTTVPVGTPGGVVELRVPAHSQAGRQLRLRGRGLPALAGGAAAGDLYAVLAVVLPPADTATAQAAYRRMATDLAFDPRAAQEA